MWGIAKCPGLIHVFPPSAPEFLRWLIIQQRLALLLRGCLGLDVLGVVGLWGGCCLHPCLALPVPAVKPSRGAGAAVLLCQRGGEVGSWGALTGQGAKEGTRHLPELQTLTLALGLGPAGESGQQSSVEH